jgi:predicted nuclease of predicted toxin-antitoxin system
LKIYRYRKDLWNDEVYLLHHIKKGFKKLSDAGRLNILYSGECTETLKFPKWIKNESGQFELYSLSWRPETITIISNTDFKKVCEYIRKPKQIVINTLFNFSALAVTQTYDSELAYKSDFNHSNKVCYALVTRLFL